MNEALKETCDALRKAIGELDDVTRSLKTHGVFTESEEYEGQHGEMKANIMLAYRHLEDARMRIGKVLQAADDGVSILDKVSHEPEALYG